MPDRSRHIPEAVAAALMQESRGRCCLCRELVLEGSERHQDIAEVLERHHLIYFSQGGEHALDNLLVVDPNCHRLIHRMPDRYAADILLETKQRWRNLATLLPRQLLYEGDAPETRPGEPFQLAEYPFVFETYGLTFSVVAPSSLTVAAFNSFIKQKVVNPIAASDGNDAFLRADTYYLSLRRPGSMLIPNSMLLRDFKVGDDALVLNLHVNVVARAAPGSQSDSQIIMEAYPPRPRPGESYRIRIRHTLADPFPVTITIEGTDGFRRTIEEAATRDGLTISIPGAANGVKDSIAIHGDFEVMRLELVFGGQDESHTEA